MCFGIWLDAVSFPLAGQCCTRQRAAPVRRLYIKVEIGKVWRGKDVPAAGILFRCFHSLIIVAFGRRLRSPPVLCQVLEGSREQCAASLTQFLRL